jgi:hypothetical protein
VLRQYQVVILGDEGPEAESLKTQLALKFAELQIEPELLRFESLEGISTLDRRAPVVGVYFAFDAPPADIDRHLEPLLADGHVVIPVVRDLNTVNDVAPVSLRPTNAFELAADDPEFIRLSDVVLENLSLLRRTRRLFISYRRAESRRVAIHLYEELDLRTFDVFLDTHSIRPGEPFQEVLWHRLADTDVMVLLDSPGFLNSRWTEEELARANSTSLQILQVIWPDHPQAAYSAFSQAHQLSAADFVDIGVTLGPDCRLTDEAVKVIAREAESLRARALAARHAYLVQEMFREAAAVGATITAQPGRYLKLETPDGQKAIIVPTVGVPDAVRYQEIEEDLSAEDTNDLILVFDERGIRDRWLKHLRWLNPNMKVRSLAIGEVKGWMGRRIGA